MVRKPASGIPARGYSWPQFKAGNEVRLKHGARSRTGRYIKPIAEAKIDQLLQQRPDLADEGHRSAVEAWAVAEAQNVLYRDYADQVGIIDPDTGEPYGYTNGWRRAENQAEQRRRELGIGPVAEARLTTVRAEASIVAGDLQLFIQQGREVLERRRRRQLEVGVALAEAIEDAHSGGDQQDGG